MRTTARLGLKRMQMSVGLDSLQCLNEGLATVVAIPGAGMSMPLHVEAIRADPIEADEGSVEFFAEVFRESGSIALDEAIAGTLPSAPDIDAGVERGGVDGGQELRLQDLVDEPLAGGGDARLLGL